MSISKDHTKALQRLVDALREADKASGDPLISKAAIEAAQKAVAGIDLDAINSDLEAIKRQIDQEIDRLVFERRMALAEAAREAGWPYTRIGEQDRVGEFCVQYAKTKVKILIGTEELTTTTEPDGRKLFGLLWQELRKAEASMLTRGAFFNSLRIALAMAKADGKSNNGKVKIRELFPYVAGARQLANEDFRKKPLAKNFADYSMALLALELYRFGESPEGWHYGEERLVNQPPNMATQSEAMLLPGSSGSQVLWLGIER